MKWLVFSAFLILIIPLSGYLRRNPFHSPIVWMFLGFLPFGINYFHLYMAVYSTAEWGGYVKGAEVSLLDLIALTLYFSTADVKQSLPFRGVMAFFFSWLCSPPFRLRNPSSHSCMLGSLHGCFLCMRQSPGVARIRGSLSRL